mmetsp:Transcript_23748/g.52391  ORF Transcript_23748/g.52391 Transcript_23748/m.52391 type:complete len:406 (+) Transcript_23748:74-1291(+)
MKHPLRGDSGTIARLRLHNAGNALFLASIAVGSERTPFQVVVDTGSTKLWLPGSDCACGGNHQRYTGTGSHTATNLNSHFMAGYVSGSVSGTLYRDDVWLGGVLLRIEFGVVNNACGLDGFVEAEYDGILGLGTSDGQQIGNVLIQELRRRKELDSFALRLGRLEGPELALFRRGFSQNYFNVLRAAQFDAPGLHVRLQQALVGADAIMRQPSHALVDSGSTLTLTPKADLQRLARKVGARPRRDNPSLFGLPCISALTGKLPEIQLVFEGDGKSWVWKLKPQDYVLQDRYSGKSQKEQCILAFAAHESNKRWILGCTLLRQCQVAFDAKGLQVGFALESSIPQELVRVRWPWPDPTFVITVCVAVIVITHCRLCQTLRTFLIAIASALRPRRRRAVVRGGRGQG